MRPLCLGICFSFAQILFVFQQVITRHQIDYQLTKLDWGTYHTIRERSISNNVETVKESIGFQEGDLTIMELIEFDDRKSDEASIKTGDSAK